MAKKIAYAIARESSSDRTLQNQYEDIHRIAKELGYEIVEEFGDNVTGDASKRDGEFAPYVERLQLVISKRRPDAIFINALDRLTRTTREQGWFVTEFSAIKKIPLYFAKEDVWTIDPHTGELQEDVMKRLASDVTPQEEREKIAARTRPAREKLGKEGYFIGHISDGYCVHEEWGTYKDNKKKKIKTIDIDEDRAKVIKDIFQWFLEGYSTDKIAQILNTKEIPTSNKYRSEHPEKFGYRAIYKGKDGLEHERKNAKWDGNLISQVLKNEWYKGVRHYTLKSEGKTFTLVHPHIIEPDVWDAVKRIREERSISFRSKKEPTKHPFLLSNLFYCGQCGQKMYGHYTGLNNHYYCSSMERSEKCGLRGLSKENIEAIIYDVLVADAIYDISTGRDSELSNFFHLSKEEEKSISKGISINNALIENLKQENEKLNRSVVLYIRLQGENSNDETLVMQYKKAIDEARVGVKTNNKTISKYQAENKQYAIKLTKSKGIKESLVNLRQKKDLNEIRLLFLKTIERITIFNTEKNNSVVRIQAKNGKIHEVVYSAQRMKHGYIRLDETMRYDEKANLLVNDIYPIVIDADGHYYFNEDGDLSHVEKELQDNGIRYAKLGHTFTTDDLINIRHNTATEYCRLEELSELALKQQEHYRQWRKKYNTGKPTNEPYVLRNSTYEEIMELRKKLYNRKYKIKKNKSLSYEEKELQLQEIQKELNVLTAQVPLIKPRKKRGVPQG